MTDKILLNHITYILLDAARMGDKIDDAKTMNPAHDSLYRGGSEESLSAVAPYLFRFVAGSPFADWYMQNGWGDSWGVMVKCAYPMPEMHKHFRKFLMVRTEDGQQLYFRFYDPRVLRIFLPTCDAGQIREIFGPVDYFLMEDEDPAFALRFWHENGVLKSQKMDREALTFDHSPAAPATGPTMVNTEAPVSKNKSKWNMFD